MAPRIEQEPLQLRDVGQYEVEQRRSRFRLDVALQGGDGRLVALFQLDDDGRIRRERGGCERGGRAASVWYAGTVVREQADEVAAIEDGLQRVPDQRVRFPQRFQDAGAACRRGQTRGDVDEQPPAGLVHRNQRRQLPQG